MTFGSLGYGPRAQSVLHCHGVLALRQGPWTPAWTEAVQNESQLQEDTSRVAAERKPAPGGHEQGGSWQCRNGGKVKVWELVSSRFRKWRLVVWATGRGPNPSFTAMVFWPCDRVLGLQLGPKLCRTKASSRRTRARWLQNESELQEDTSRVAVGSAETEVKSRFER